EVVRGARPRTWRHKIQLRSILEISAGNTGSSGSRILHRPFFRPRLWNMAAANTEGLYVPGQRAVIDLYAWGTANGLRESVALAECGLEHRIHKIDLNQGEQKRPEFLALNPAGQIPVKVDPAGPGGERLVLAQSGAILIYAAEKAGKFLLRDVGRRATM